MSWKLAPLPYPGDIETKAILRKLPAAHRALAELKGVAQTIPNQSILINTLALQEAKDSSEVENIITTHDELYKTELNLVSPQPVAAKEVQNYVAALKRGFELVQKRHILSANLIKEVQQVLEGNTAGFRKVPGTTLKNQQTGEIIYEPPQDIEMINALMSNLEHFINDETLADYDPLVKMAVIHFQFESIHPFYDGNGRTGRIINMLYLVLSELLDLPILYLSRYIIQNKTEYYAFLQEVRDKNDWNNWLLFMIDAIEKTALQTIGIISSIRDLMLNYKHQIRDKYKFYSQELLNNLFSHPYTKIEFLEQELSVSRITAANYLNQLADGGFLTKHRIGKSNYYINAPLMEIFQLQQTLKRIY